jgi:hypothetical protein
MRGFRHGIEEGEAEEERQNNSKVSVFDALSAMLFRGWAEFSPGERLPRSINTVKLLPDHVKRAASTPRDFCPIQSCGNKRPFARDLI